MATLTTNTTHRESFFATAFDALARTIRQRRMYRTTVTELSRLSLRELDDLGIAPGDIQRIAKEAAEIA